MDCIKPTILLAVVTVLVGCVAVNKPLVGKQNEDLMVTAQLRRTIADTDARIDELDNKLMILQGKVDAARVTIQRLHGRAGQPKNSAKDQGSTSKVSAKPVEPVELIEPAAIPVAISVAVPTKTAEPPRGLKLVKLKDDVVKVRNLPSAIPATAAPSSHLSTDDPEKAYERGQDLFASGRFVQARRVFFAIAGNHPAHSLADNALYWIGETYYSEKDYENALLNFAKVIDLYPAGNKVPDAMLKQGFSYHEAGDSVSSTRVLQRLIEMFPDSSAAVKAAKKLEGTY